MRSYDVAIASLAIDAPIRWTDNAISQHAIRDVLSDRRGVARRLTFPALLRLAIVRQLHVGLGIGVGVGVHLAGELLDSGTPGVHVSGQLRLLVDLPALEQTLNTRLAHALESAPSPRRGRPPRRAKT